MVESRLSEQREGELARLDAGEQTERKPLPAGQSVGTHEKPTAREPRSGLEVAKDWVDLLAKALPVAAGVVYLTGYIVTSRRLASYGIATTQLVNAQYFVAGTAPSLLLALTVAVAWSALAYSRTGKRGDALGRVLIAAGVLFLIALIGELADPRPTRLADNQFSLGFWLEAYGVTLTLVRIAFAESALWCVIVALRTGLVAKFRSHFGPQEQAEVRMLIAVLTLAAVVVITGAFGRAARIYGAIPQAYGGARPLNVELYAETAKLPAELLPPRTASPSTALTYTASLQLLFQSSSVMIVRPLGDSLGRVWAIDPRNVLAVRSIAPR